MEAELVASGRFVRIEMLGRSSGLPRTVTLGFVEDPSDLDAGVIVAAGAPDSGWALNLLQDPACRVTIAERRFEAVAEPLDGAAHAAAITALILRYGTPAEGLGVGPTFRLRPTGGDARR
jgi:deazaflavin-dependent oxidoreductase (nitroreductase family)